MANIAVFGMFITTPMNMVRCKTPKGEKFMSTWYSVDLGDGVEAYNPTEQIQKVFTPIFAASGCQEDMAVFSSYDLVPCNIISFVY